MTIKENKRLVKVIDEVLEYIWYDEYEDYQRMKFEQPEEARSHIYLKLEELEKLKKKLIPKGVLNAK